MSSLRILLLEDDSRDAELIRERLEAENFVCEIARVQTRVEFLTALNMGEIDLILADYKLPSFDGISALKLALSTRPDVPFIFVSGTLGEELAIEALKMGATDYVLKTGLPRLASSVRRAMREAGERAERKKAEEALRRSEAFLADAQRLSRTGSFGWNVSSGELYWSDETYRIFEYETTTKPTIQMIIDRTHPGDRMQLQQIIDRAMTEGGDFTAEHRLIMPDGSVKYVRAVARPSTGQDPQSFFYVGAIVDITERKRVEQALLESEEQWKAVFENNPTMYFMVSETDMIVSVNRLGADQLGYATNELIGHPVEILMHEADREHALTNKALCRDRLGQTVSWELRKIRKDGEIIWVRETGRAMLIKNRPVVLIVSEDITEARRAEYYVTQVFHSSPDGISIVGRDYRYQRVNPVYERNWDMPADRIVGKHVAELLGVPVFEQTVKPYLDRCFEGEEISFADWFTNSVGRSYLAVTYSPLRPRSERVDAAMVITRDLTDHLRASDALREMQMQLAHANRVATMGQLTASIAHEVNQPIAATVANAQAALRWLGAEPPNLGEVRQALDRIVRDGARAGAVIGRTRNLVKKAPPAGERVEVNAAILEVIELARSEAMKNRVTVHTDLAEGLPPISGDRVELQQVILNLTLNALEAMSEMSEGTRELVIRTVKTEPGDVLVAVRDSGPGLAPAATEHLFAAFYTTKPNGLGLGLSICRSIIEAQGGRLWVAENPGPGATFCFTLPRETHAHAPDLSVHSHW